MDSVSTRGCDGEASLAGRGDHARVIRDEGIEVAAEGSGGREVDGVQGADRGRLEGGSCLED